jgi:hypothetical protein
MAIIQVPFGAVNPSASKGPFLGVTVPLINLRAPDAAFGLLEPHKRLRATKVQFSSFSVFTLL